jgi:hypothetical protein
MAFGAIQVNLSPDWTVSEAAAPAPGADTSDNTDTPAITAIQLLLRCIMHLSVKYSDTVTLPTGENDASRWLRTVEVYIITKYV